MARKSKSSNLKLSIKGAALSIGIVWGAAIFLLGISGMLGYGLPIISTLSTLYLGFFPSVKGILIGTLWGFADGFVGGAVLAWVYNKFA